MPLRAALARADTAAQHAMLLQAFVHPTRVKMAEPVPLKLEADIHVHARLFTSQAIAHISIPMHVQRAHATTAPLVTHCRKARLAVRARAAGLIQLAALLYVTMVIARTADHAVSPIIRSIAPACLTIMECIARTSQPQPARPAQHRLL